MNKLNFIKTSDEQTAKLLRESGFTELAKEDGKYVFVNDSNKLLTMEKIKNVQKTNMLHF